MSVTDTAPATEKKPRKTRVAGPKAPSRKDNPAGYQLHYLDNAIKTIQKRDDQVTGWGVDGLSKHFGDALFSLQEARTAIAGLPVDFKAPRKRGGGGGRKAKRFEAGQVVTLSAKALEMVQQVFPDVAADCTFVVNPKMIISEGTKLYSIGCTGVGGTLPWFYVGFYGAKDLTLVA